MSTKNLSAAKEGNLPPAEGMRFGVVVSEWNEEITSKLREAAVNTLISAGASPDDIVVTTVPGSFELTLGAQWLAEYIDPDAIICLGSVIQGETPHFTYVCQGVTQGITTLNLEYNIPVIFGVLTTNTALQAKERAGGKLGNKGDEAAATAIRMVNLHNSLRG